MDDKQTIGSERSSVVLASVVRHFSPSRVERELLTQALQLAFAIGRRHSQHTVLEASVRAFPFDDDRGSDGLRRTSTGTEVRS